MNVMVDAAIAAMAQWLLLLAEVSVRAVVLLGAAGVVAWLLRRRAAAVRSALWHAVACALLLLPVLSVVLPRWQLGTSSAVAESGGAMATRLSEWAGLTETSPGLRGGRTGSAVFVGESSPERIVSTPNGTRSPWTITVSLFLLWISGVAVVAAQLLRSVSRIMRVERRARAITDTVLTSDVASLLPVTGLPRGTRILEGPSHAIPMTWGIVRPRVMLPGGWDQWPPSATAAVLAHELAHVRRHDVLRQLPWDLVRALFWFNPLIVLGARASHLACEQACDDEVVGRGLAPTTYADALLTLVRALRKVGSVGAPAIAGSGERELARRIGALVDSSRDRRASRLAVVATVSIVAMFAMGSATASLATTVHDGPRRSSRVDTRWCCEPVTDPTVVGPAGRALDSAFAMMAAGGLSGTILVSVGNDVVFAKGFGFADRERQVRASVSTRYHVAGVTKAFTAAAVADLIDRGIVRAGAPLGQYFPELGGVARAVTIHQLLTHTDGLREVAPTTSTTSATAFLASLGGATARFTAGTSYQSTDVSHSLLALLVERVSGRPFEHYVRDRLLGPAAMTHSFLRFDTTAAAAEIAVGYAADGVPVPVVRDEDGWGVRGSRGLVTTVGDLRRWHAALVDGRLVRQGALDLMFRPYLRTEKPFGQGYGWLLYDAASGPPFGGGPLPVRRRSGREAGFEAELVHDPNGNWVAVVLLNHDDGRRLDAMRLIRTVMNAHPPPGVATR
jgi:CubicO group peptidase (beta-lactamase class C family)/beta-lactamase regulating signal transducer with metallopeptidase domain